jgi:hypothetical protein
MSSLAHENITSISAHTTIKDPLLRDVDVENSLQHVPIKSDRNVLYKFLFGRIFATPSGATWLENALAARHMGLMERLRNSAPSDMMASNFQYGVVIWVLLKEKAQWIN